MPRIARKYMTVSFFHLMTQGINKEYIFENKKDKTMYEKLIFLYKDEFDVNILSYSIMDNHTHILIKVETVESMSKFMHKVNTQYATYYNKKYGRTGYVFKNRYKAQMINSLKHLYRCIDYIHDNPVKAGICKNRNQYQYSSFTKLYQCSQTKAMIALERYLKDSFIDKKHDSDENNLEDNDNIIFLEDMDEDKQSICEKEINKYIVEKQIDRKILLKNKENLREIVSRLKSKKISYRIMAEKLGIGRETLRRLNIESSK